MPTKVERVLIFDLKGPFAHFRKYYTNSSSLSYSFPPRTTLIGLIAGLIGDERDSYYEKFSDEHCKVAVSVRKSIRKIMQTVNYTSTKSEHKYSFGGVLKGEVRHTQIPLEVVCPKVDEELVYRIYFHHTDPDTYKKVEERLTEKRFIYPPYLGITEFLGEIEYISEGKVTQEPSNGEYIEISSVCRKDAIAEGGLSFEMNSAVLQYLIEKMPSNFSRERDVTRYADYLFERNSSRLQVRLKEEFHRINYREGKHSVSENVIFM